MMGMIILEQVAPLLHPKLQVHYFILVMPLV